MNVDKLLRAVELFYGKAVPNVICVVGGKKEYTVLAEEFKRVQAVPEAVRSLELSVGRFIKVYIGVKLTYRNDHVASAMETVKAKLSDNFEFYRIYGKANNHSISTDIGISGDTVLDTEQIKQKILSELTDASSAMCSELRAVYLDSYNKEGVLDSTVLRAYTREHLDHSTDLVEVLNIMSKDDVVRLNAVLPKVCDKLFGLE